MECYKCDRSCANYTLGSAIITLFIGVFAFLVSLAWANYANKKIDMLIDPETEMKARLYYAVVLTLIAIVFIFLLLYYIPGEKC